VYAWEVQPVNSPPQTMSCRLGVHWQSLFSRPAPQLTIAPVLHEIDEDRIRAHVAQIVGFGPRCEERPDAVRSTIAYLTSHLTASGYSAYIEPCGAKFQVNVIAEAKGVTAPSRVLEFAAHYDTIPNSSGADDNASGLAGLLELARALAGARLERTIRFCFFGLEEVDKSGSRAHVKTLDVTPRESVEGTVVFEMIGFRTFLANSQRTPFRFPFVFWPPTTGDFIAVVSNTRSRDLATLFVRAARRYVPNLRMFVLKRLGGYLADAVRSDHVSYWRSGRKGIMITDTANFRNPNYHKSTDTADTLDYAFIREIIQASAATALEWANHTDAAQS
jgi:aminopeptidase YwaD